MAEWNAFDKRYRRSKRLLAFFVGWNLLAIFVSLIGFAFMYRVVSHWSSWAMLWVLVIGTVGATGVMLMEVHGSLDRLREYRWLRPIFTLLEDG